METCEASRTRNGTRVQLPLDPETALRALLAVDPGHESADDEDVAQVQRKDQPDR